MDLRYQQLEQETQLETQASAGLYAFEGFGRSTENAAKADIIGGLNQARVATLDRVIAAENALSLAKTNEEFDSLSKQLSFAQQAFDQQAQDARKRRTELSLKLAGAGAAADQEVGQLLSNRQTRAKQSFKVAKPLVQQTAPFKAKLDKLKPLTNILSPLNSLRTITPLNSFRSFGSQIKSLTA